MKWAKAPHRKHITHTFWGGCGIFVLLCAKIILINGVCICGKSPLFSVSIYLEDIFAYLFFLFSSAPSHFARHVSIRHSHAYTFVPTHGYTHTHGVLSLFCHPMDANTPHLFYFPIHWAHQEDPTVCVSQVSCSVCMRCRSMSVRVVVCRQNKVASPLGRRIHHSDEGEDEKYFSKNDDLI